MSIWPYSHSNLTNANILPHLLQALFLKYYWRALRTTLYLPHLYAPDSIPESNSILSYRITSSSACHGLLAFRPILHPCSPPFCMMVEESDGLFWVCSVPECYVRRLEGWRKGKPDILFLFLSTLFSLSPLSDVSKRSCIPSVFPALTWQSPRWSVSCQRTPENSFCD